MFDKKDKAYFARRAAEARKLATSAPDESAKLAHLAMAEEYERRAKGLAPMTIKHPNDT